MRLLRCVRCPYMCISERVQSGDSVGTVILFCYNNTSVVLFIYSCLFIFLCCLCVPPCVVLCGCWGGPPLLCSSAQEPMGSRRVTSGVSLPPPATRKSEAGPGQSPVSPDALFCGTLTLMRDEVWGCQCVCVCVCDETLWSYKRDADRLAEVNPVSTEPRATTVAAALSCPVSSGGWAPR